MVSRLEKISNIQPGKSYAQALILGRETNLGPVHFKPKQYNVTLKQASKIGNFDRDNNCSKNKYTVPVQVNTPRVSQCGGSVAGVPRVSKTPVQVQLKNRFQVFQDSLHHEPCDDQWGHKFRVISKEAKGHKSDKVASITQNVKEEVPKAQIQKKLQLSFLQQTQGIKNHSQNVQNL